MILGYSALAMFGLQFVLTARFKRATAPFGIDLIYALHRWLAIAALLFVMVHVILLAWRYPAALGSADPLRAPWHMSAGRLALILFAFIVLSSLLRKRLRWAYESWRFGMDSPPPQRSCWPSSMPKGQGISSMQRGSSGLGVRLPPSGSLRSSTFACSGPGGSRDDRGGSRAASVWRVGCGACACVQSGMRVSGVSNLGSSLG